MTRRTLDILEVITRNACTVKEIATAIGRDIGPVWEHTRKLVRADLVVEVGARKRAGRPQKLYRASAHEFYVGSDVRQTTIGRELSRVLEYSFECSDDAIGELFYYDGSRWRVEKTYRKNAANKERPQEFWLIARLDSRQRERLLADVRELFETYRREQTASVGRSLIRFACAPLPEEKV